MTVKFNTTPIVARARAGAARGVFAATEMVRGEAISLILDTPKTGRIYRRRSVEHQASAPDEPPASDTGRLVGAMRTGFSDDGLVGTVIASTTYAAALEYGTARMAPRPFMRVALANRRRDIATTINAHVRAALAGGQ